MFTARSTLTGRVPLDFLVVGGLSLLLWPLFMLVFPKSGMAIAALLFAVNYPHFMASYKLAYGRGLPFVKRRWPQLILAPLLLLLIVGLGFLYRATSTDCALVHLLDDVLALIGAKARFARYSTLNGVALALLLHAMYLSVGWHYAKQTFGATMVTARYEKFSFAPWERRALRVHLLSIWWLSWAASNTSSAASAHADFSLFLLGMPDNLKPIAIAVAVVTGVVVVVAWVSAARRNERPPSMVTVTPLVALWLWLVPFYDSPLFVVYVATFHSLQYLGFVFRVERRRDNPPWHLLVMFATLVVTGWVSFMSLPVALDWLSGTGTHYFFVGIIAAINVHHYFIDNVIWRFDDPEVRSLLL